MCMQDVGGQDAAFFGPHVGLIDAQVRDEDGARDAVFLGQTRFK